MKDKLSAFWSGFKDKWSSLAKNLRIFIITAVSVVIVAAIVLAIVLNQKGYTAIYTGLDSEESSQVVSAINELGITDVKMGTDGSISVPSDQADNVRMQLSIQGYPKSTFNFDVWNSGIGIWSTDTEKKVLQIQQLQTHLMKAINTISAVKNSYVIITMPENSNYVISTDSEEPRVSVKLDLKNGAQLTSDQVEGIYALVLNSLPGLERENISILDSDGKLLSGENTTVEEDVLYQSRLNFQEQMQSLLKSQLNDLLVNIVVSMSVDNNCPDDNDKTILLEGSNAQVRLLPVTGSSATSTQAYVQDGTSTVFLSSRQLRAATNAQPGAAVTVNATDPAADTVILAGHSIANARSAGVAALQVQLAAGTVTLDSDALAALDLHKDVAVSLTGASLNAAQQRALGSQAATATLANVSVTVDGAAASYPAGSVRASVPVRAADDLTAWSLADDGTISAAGGAWDAQQQTYAFDVISGVTAIARFPFADVPAGSWYYGAAAYAYNNGLFAGTTDTTFAPDMTMTRAMLVSVLWRLAGEPAPKGANTFDDVPDGAWYTDAVTWAAENGVVAGIGNGCFDPSGAVTREQTAVILFNYAQSKGYDVSARADLSAFPDAGSVSGWAQEALAWANASGLISGAVRGTQTILDPQGSASRAQVAMILMGYVEHVVNA